MRRKIALIGGGTALSAGAVYIGLPFALALGVASACACAQRTADTSAKWEACARHVIEGAKASELLPVTRFVVTDMADGRKDQHWTEPAPSPQFESFLNQVVTPQCGSFAEVRQKDLDLKRWRDFYGYEELYIPGNASALLAKAVY